MVSLSTGRGALAVLVLFLALATGSDALLVQRPCCSAYAHAGAQFGPRLPWVAPSVAGILSRGTDKDCNGAVANSVVMIDRGLEPFVDAVRACQSKGAVAVVVRNVANMGGGGDDLIVMGAMDDAADVHIPSVFVSRNTGDDLDTFLALEPSVYVELMAADDINSIMAYLAYLIMSVEMFFVTTVIFTLVILIFARRMYRRHSRMREGRSSNRRCCGRCRRRDEASAVRSSLILSSDGAGDLTQPLTRSMSNDPEQKPIKSAPAVRVVQVYPIVLGDGNASHVQSVSLQVDASNDEPVFEQQEQ